VRLGVITNSWATRAPRRDDTMVVQIDGTQGSCRGRAFPAASPNRAAGRYAGSLHDGRPGRAASDLIGALAGKCRRRRGNKNPFRQCWETFLRHRG